MKTNIKNRYYWLCQIKGHKYVNDNSDYCFRCQRVVYDDTFFDKISYSIVKTYLQIMESTICQGFGHKWEWNCEASTGAVYTFCSRCRKSNTRYMF